MADDGDDDYLSDKFLSITEPQKPKTYSEKRKESLRKSLLKDERNRTKSTRHLELETRAEGLSKSLFERAEDDKVSGRGMENKALSMMMKMGFKPGQVLGVPPTVDEDPALIRTTPPRRNPSPSPETLAIQPQIHEGRLVNPLPLNVWSGMSSLPPVFRPAFSARISSRPRSSTDSVRRAIHIYIGKQGIGLGKRAPSPTELERLAKVARDTEEANKESFRDRSRREFEQRHAEARLGLAQRTCETLDERAGKKVSNNCMTTTLHSYTRSLVPVPPANKNYNTIQYKVWLSADIFVPQFNALWLDPINPDGFPAGLWDAVASTAAAPAAGAAAVPAWGQRSTEERLREQMQADALQPLDDGDEDEDEDNNAAAAPKNADLNTELHLPPKMIEQAAQFLRLNVSAHDRPRT